MSSFHDKELAIQWMLKNYPRGLEPMGIGDLPRESQELLVQSVDRVLAMLPKEERRIIQNEFIYFYDKDWWMEYYGHSTYYRLKNKAMADFIEAICQR